ncbi:hypothetical protein FOL47_010285 [Perkinsus chesapeaki]|uniref:subtilisin n=1 Tax=Perkinsus chesapeaki TaxID=330153 RepID=A0A7J6L3M6_PERCH|nr:hypothetical protein FOL47_010285 [Perkinsus chesapeaki]
MTMTAFIDTMTLPRLSKYVLHYCLIWSLEEYRISKALGQLPFRPNDPYFSNQRALFDSLLIEETWRVVRESGLSRRDVIVTVIDAGVAPKQPDLVGKLLGGHDASGSIVPSVEDMQGHGTDIASIITAGINNGIGIAGIADSVKIRPIRLTTYISGSSTDEEI